LESNELFDTNALVSSFSVMVSVQPRETTIPCESSGWPESIVFRVTDLVHASSVLHSKTFASTSFFEASSTLPISIPVDESIHFSATTSFDSSSNFLELTRFPTSIILGQTNLFGPSLPFSVRTFARVLTNFVPSADFAITFSPAQSVPFLLTLPIRNSHQFSQSLTRDSSKTPESTSTFVYSDLDLISDNFVSSRTPAASDLFLESNELFDTNGFVSSFSVMVSSHHNITLCPHERSDAPNSVAAPETDWVGESRALSQSGSLANKSIRFALTESLSSSLLGLQTPDCVQTPEIKQTPEFYESTILASSSRIALSDLFPDSVHFPVSNELSRSQFVNPSQSFRSSHALLFSSIFGETRIIDDSDESSESRFLFRSVQISLSKAYLSSSEIERSLDFDNSEVFTSGSLALSHWPSSLKFGRSSRFFESGNHFASASFRKSEKMIPLITRTPSAAFDVTDCLGHSEIYPGSVVALLCSDGLRISTELDCSENAEASDVIQPSPISHSGDLNPSISYRSSDSSIESSVVDDSSEFAESIFPWWATMFRPSNLELVTAQFGSSSPISDSSRHMKISGDFLESDILSETHFFRTLLYGFDRSLLFLSELFLPDSDGIQFSQPIRFSNELDRSHEFLPSQFLASRELLSSDSNIWFTSPLSPPDPQLNSHIDLITLTISGPHRSEFVLSPGKSGVWTTMSDSEESEGRAAKGGGSTKSTALIVGILAAVILLLCIIIFLIFVWQRSRAKTKGEDMAYDTETECREESMDESELAFDDEDDLKLGTEMPSWHGFVEDSDDFDSAFDE
jgi:hypothetical protein